VTDGFLRAVEADGEWELTARRDGKVTKTLRARDLWDQIGHAAWACADPGIQFHDTVNAWHTCPADGAIRGSNPCSEYMFLDDTACNLASLNLLTFYKDGEFRVEDYIHASRLWTLTLEISVTMAQFPSKEIAQRSYDFRTLGLGFANIGGLLMNMGLSYDSDEGRALCGALTAIMTGTSYATSALIAAELGPFAGFARNSEAMLRVIRNHRRAAHGQAGGYEGLAVPPVPLDHANVPDARLSVLAMQAWDEALTLGEAHGYRNAQATVIAPTGTIGLVMDCDTTGIEPDFALVKFKKLAGGGYFKIINQSCRPGAAQLGYRESRSPRSRPTPSATAPGQAPASTPSLGPRRRERRSRAGGGAESGLRHQVRLQPVALARTSSRHARKSRRSGSTTRPSTILASGFEGPDRAPTSTSAGHDAGGRAAPEPEHYPVFDCANPCGKTGKRYLSVRSHITMMAAARASSPGPSPRPSTCRRRHHQGLPGRLRPVLGASASRPTPLYRDGSKLSQPLASALIDGDDEAEEVFAQGSQQEKVAVLAEKVVEKIVIRRSARASGQDAPAAQGLHPEGHVGGHKVYLRTGEYEDGPLGEIFIDMHKEGAASGR
jgi:ribonucleoside-diphosphate reductase alpha chain